MDKESDRPDELGREELARLAVDFLHRTIVHHTLWFAEVEHQLGMAKALDLMGAVWEKSYAVQMKRLSEAFGFELENGLPKALLALPKEELLRLLGDLGKTGLPATGSGSRRWRPATGSGMPSAATTPAGRASPPLRPGRSGDSSASPMHQASPA